MEIKKNEFKEKIKNVHRIKYLEEVYTRADNEEFKVLPPKNNFNQGKYNYYINLINNHNKPKIIQKEISIPINYKLIDSSKKIKKKKKNNIINTAIKIWKKNKLDKYKKYFKLKIPDKKKRSVKVRDKKLYKTKKYLEYSWEKNRPNNNKEILERLRLDKKNKNNKLNIIKFDIPEDIICEDIDLDMKNNVSDKERIKEEEKLFYYVVAENARRNEILSRSFSYNDPNYYNIIKINPYKENIMEIEEKLVENKEDIKKLKLGKEDINDEKMMIEEDLNEENKKLMNECTQFVEEKKKEVIKINIIDKNKENNDLINKELVIVEEKKYDENKINNNDKIKNNKYSINEYTQIVEEKKNEENKINNTDKIKENKESKIEEEKIMEEKKNDEIKIINNDKNKENKETMIEDDQMLEEKKNDKNEINNIDKNKEIKDLMNECKQFMKEKRNNENNINNNDKKKENKDLMIEEEQIVEDKKNDKNEINNIDKNKKNKDLMIEDEQIVEEKKNDENNINNNDKNKEINNSMIVDDQFMEEKKNDDININNNEKKDDNKPKDNLLNLKDNLNKAINDHNQEMGEENKINNDTDTNLKKNYDIMDEDNGDNNCIKENNIQDIQKLNNEIELCENQKSDNNILSDIICDQPEIKNLSEKGEDVVLKLDNDNKINSNYDDAIKSGEINSNLDIKFKKVNSEHNIFNDSNQINLSNMNGNPNAIKEENNPNPVPQVKNPFVNKKNNKYYLFLKQFKKVKFNKINNSNKLDKNTYEYVKDNLIEIKEIKKYLKSHKIDERKVIDLKIECNNNIFTPETIDNYISDIYLDSNSYIFKYDLINGIDSSKVNIYWGNYKYFIFVRYGYYTDVKTDKSDSILSEDFIFLLIKGFYEYYTSIVYKIYDNNYISYFCIKFSKNYQINTCHFENWLKLENNIEKFYHIRSGNYGNSQIEYNHTKYNTRRDNNRLKEEDEELLKLYENKNKFGFY